mmetsp:Transcript_41559/g.50395  ORF Transcript_41559/g.50395 Transcript_41559/m.50395 type:complete len:213 (+) Transcript_41559:144-782(+)
MAVGSISRTSSVTSKPTHTRSQQGASTPSHASVVCRRTARVPCSSTLRLASASNSVRQGPGYTGFAHSARRASSIARRRVHVCADAEEKEREFVQNTEFGYSRKDVLLIGVAFTAAGFGAYYGLQAAGFDMVTAGNIILIVLTLGGMVAWTASYIFRVANKDMTYVKQLKAYEDAVMEKRLEEMPEAELEKLLMDVEEENEVKDKKKAERGL